jgi:hypothetical protein
MTRCHPSVLSAVQLVAGDGYLARSRSAEIVLLLASVVFCATTFSSDGLHQWIGLPPEGARYGLGVASVAAFAASLVLLLIDWKGKAARHQDAATRWSAVVAQFREAQTEAGGWPADKGTQLHKAYWGAADDSVDVPDRRFNRLKAKYLMKVEISKRSERNPGVPRFVLWMIVRFTGTLSAVRECHFSRP